MTAELERWLSRATRHLSCDSAAQVRGEIQEHYEAAREAAVNGGATPDRAGQVALTALGSPGRANCEYRKVLLTSAEARLLRQGNWEARAVCSHRLVRSLLFAMPAIALFGAMELFRYGAAELARVLFAGALATGFLFVVPLLPIYTPARSRLVRYVKWAVLAALPVVAFGSEAFKFSWLIIASLWPVAWVEWTRISIRRKLPVAQWPKQLYL